MRAEAGGAMEVSTVRFAGAKVAQIASKMRAEVEMMRRSPFAVVELGGRVVVRGAKVASRRCGLALGGACQPRSWR